MNVTFSDADEKFLKSLHIEGEEQKVIAQLAEYGIGFQSDRGHDAHERDYGHRRKAAPKPAVKFTAKRDDLVGLSMFALACAGAVGLMLWWSL